MEQSSFDLETAKLGYGILSAIPVVFFALFLDYFERDLQFLKQQASAKKNLLNAPVFQVQHEIEKTRSICLLSMLLEFTFFAGFEDVRHAFPGISWAILASTLGANAFLQMRVERVILSRVDQYPLLKILVRALGVWFLGFFSYLFILTACLSLALVASTWMHVPRNVGVFYLLIGGMVGSFLGFGLTWAIGPFQLRKIFPTQKLDDSVMSTQLEACFKKIGMELPSICLLNLGPFPVYTVLIMGLRSQVRFFQRTLFISTACFKILTPRELEALILNQASHFLLRHVQKRLLFSGALLGVTLFLSSVLSYLHLDFLGEKTSPGVAFCLFVGVLSLLHWQAKKQALESDLYTVEKLGVSPSDFLKALGKTDPGSIQTARRIAILRQKLPLEDTHDSNQKAA